jgi:DNA-directed RNA polymerase II subunit RPB1
VAEIEREWEQLCKDRESLRQIFPTGNNKVTTDDKPLFSRSIFVLFLNAKVPLKVVSMKLVIKRKCNVLESFYILWTILVTIT